MIIACHAAAHGITQQVKISVSNYSWQLGVSQFFYLAGDVGNNLFILVTGYFMCDGKINKRRVFDIAFDLHFYNYIILLIVLLVLRWDIGLKRTMLQMFPLLTGRNWFVSCYLLFCLLLPFINLLLQKVDEKRHKLLCVIVIVLYSLRVFKIQTFVTVGNYMDRFVVMYIVGAYLKKHGVPRKLISSIWFYLSWVSMIIYVASVGVISQVTGKDIFLNNIYMLEYFWGTIVSIISFIATLKIEKFSNRIINGIAKSTMGIFLISENSLIAVPLWTNLFPCLKYIESIFFFPVFLAMVVSVFFLCLILDKIKDKLFFLLKKYKDDIYNIVNAIFAWLVERIYNI